MLIQISVKDGKIATIFDIANFAVNFNYILTTYPSQVNPSRKVIVS